MFIEAKILENSAAFTITFNRWGNLRKADKDQIQTDAAKVMLKLSKNLIESPEYDAICKFQSEVRDWLCGRSVPSFFKKGIYLFKIEMIEEVEAYLKQKIADMNILVEKLVTGYPEQKESAKSRLNGQYKETDYPSLAELRESFGFTWYWVKFGIPENLPENIFQEEKAKAEKMWADATEQIILCLRESFRKLIGYAVDKLKTSPGEKPKIFRDSLIENIQEFISTFNARNLTNDTELQELIEKTKVILTAGGSAEMLRGNMGLRNFTADKFTEIEKTLDTMITERPSRQFVFDE